MEKIIAVKTGELITAKKLNEIIENIEEIKTELKYLRPIVDMLEPKHPKNIYSETIINSIGMTFRLIPAGNFQMGSEEYGHDYDEGPVHSVDIHNHFYLGIYTVTQREFEAVMGGNPSIFKGDRLPVENVSWDDVQEFIKQLNIKENTDKYRLPSEAEWEYAARAGTTTRYSFGDLDTDLKDYAWYQNNSYIDKFKTYPVGQKKPNPWGLYDMHGNVLEWVQDIYHENYNDAPNDGSAWVDKGTSFRVLRGGSFSTFDETCRSANRAKRYPTLRYDDQGFRLLKEL